MKKLMILVLLTAGVTYGADESCKTVKSCSEWATNKTGIKYDLGKYEKRSLKLEKDFLFTEGDADFNFNFILQSNDLVRLKREGGVFQIIGMKDIKDYQFPTIIKMEEIPGTLDFYSAEFSLANKERVKNAQIIIKKMLSKNGRVLEVSDAPRLHVIDTGIQLNAIKTVINELNK